MTTTDGQARLRGTLQTLESELTLQGSGNGPLSALVDACAHLGLTFDIADYHQHSAGDGADSEAYAYVEIRVGTRQLFGAARDQNVLTASLQALICALNRAIGKGWLAMESRQNVTRITLTD